jgi:hypothetical protein
MSTQSGLNINLTLINAEHSLEFQECTARLLETSLLQAVLCIPTWQHRVQSKALAQAAYRSCYSFVVGIDVRDQDLHPFKLFT